MPVKAGDVFYSERYKQSYIVTGIDEQGCLFGATICDSGDGWEWAPLNGGLPLNSSRFDNEQPHPDPDTAWAQYAAWQLVGDHG